MAHVILQQNVKYAIKDAISNTSKILTSHIVIASSLPKSQHLNAETLRSFHSTHRSTGQLGVLAEMERLCLMKLIWLMNQIGQAMMKM